MLYFYKQQLFRMCSLVTLNSNALVNSLTTHQDDAEDGKFIQLRETSSLGMIYGVMSLIQTVVAAQLDRIPKTTLLFV